MYGSKCQFAFNSSLSAYTTGYGVYVPGKVHKYLTKWRPIMEVGNTNLFSNQNIPPTMEDLFEHKKVINNRIIQIKADDLFENESFSRSDLMIAYSWASDVCLSEVQDRYKREGLCSEEFYACGRVKNVMNHLDVGVDNLNDCLRHFERKDAYRQLSYSKVAEHTSALFQRIELGFEYAKGIEKLIIEDPRLSATNLPWPDFAIPFPGKAEVQMQITRAPVRAKVESTIARIARLEALGYDTSNPRKYLSSAKIRSHDPPVLTNNSYLHRLDANSQISTWPELGVIGNIVHPDRLEGTRPILFHKKTNLSLFSL